MNKDDIYLLFYIIGWSLLGTAIEMLGVIFLTILFTMPLIVVSIILFYIFH